MSDVANALGVPAIFHYKGKDYKVGPRTLRVEAELERRLQDAALASVQSMRKSLYPDEYRMMLDGVRRDVAARTYSWGSEACVNYLTTLHGMRQLWFLQLCAANPEEPLTMEWFEEVWDDPDAFERLQVKMAEVDADPNRKGAAK